MRRASGTLEAVRRAAEAVVVGPTEQAVERRAEAVPRGLRALALPSAGQVSVSVGLAVDDGASDVDALVRRADEAFFRAKRAGRDRFSW